ncbi:OmpA family protein [Parapedobacter sp. SGR-10]|uniref:OmpA family protein n=1 Tax=Parapedobacter sp. SGR-10 TaxID=2710879 RepID=UPI0013D67F42|nr:OmpA family protein [Parapedobacter sp. SGR-10]NGF55275.1 OmpA family protein [Parapedobacter sp. SGR-10]
MKKLLLTLMLLSCSFLTFAQESSKGDLQIGVQGGSSVPMDSYKKVGETKIGYYTGLFVDKYFSGNKFGIGVDARYIYNEINKQDSFKFENGHFGTDYRNKTRFQDFLFTLGPTYKFSKNKFQLEAYVRGGIMMQYFPEYVRTMTYTDALGNATLYDPKWTENGPDNRANSWAGLGGLRFNYVISPKIAVFAHADYVQTFGTKFGSKASQFTVKNSVEIQPVDATTSVLSFLDHYEELQVSSRTPHQTVQAGIGVKMIFGKTVPVVPPKKEEPVKYEDIPAPVAKTKALQIVVKDKQTNLALSGVTVSISGGSVEEKSISDASGQAAKIEDIKPGNYQIVGEKNGIKTPILTLSEADFKSNSSVIFKEIYHDDPRFTLVGETFDCTTQSNLGGINTMLTNTGNKTNISQISDTKGQFIYQLDPQSEFTVVANQQGKYSQTELVSTKGLDRSQTLYVTLKLGVCELVKDSSWELKNILYDFDKSDIRPDAALILDNVVSILKQNPSLRIELSSHTDSRGNDGYNLKLSQRRADSAVDYLVKNGISRNRLISKGYGETRLKNNCGNGADCSEEQHQENRRTEIKVLDF